MEKKKFLCNPLSFENLIGELRSREDNTNKLHLLKTLIENISQEFVDCLNLTTETEDINAIRSEQQDLLVQCERIRSKALSRLEWKNETRSNTSLRSCRSVSLLRSLKKPFFWQRRLTWSSSQMNLQQRLCYSD